MDFNAVRHYLLVETRFPYFFRAVRYEFKNMNNWTYFFCKNVPNGTATLFERTNFVGLSYYGSLYKRGAATM